MKKAFAICGLIGLTVLPVDGGQRISIAVSPAKAFAPATLRVRARIEPNEANRSLSLIADGENFYRSSAIPLDGDQAPRIVELWFPNVPGGEYEVLAVLTDSTGRDRAVARESVSILSSGGQ
jgi:hypothetical protein